MVANLEEACDSHALYYLIGANTVQMDYLAQSIVGLCEVFVVIWYLSDPQRWGHVHSIQVDLRIPHGEFFGK